MVTFVGMGVGSIGGRAPTPRRELRGRRLVALSLTCAAVASSAPAVHAQPTLVTDGELSVDMAVGGVECVGLPVGRRDPVGCEGLDLERMVPRPGVMGALVSVSPEYTLTVVIVVERGSGFDTWTSEDVSEYQAAVQAGFRDSIGDFPWAGSNQQRRWLRTNPVLVSDFRMDIPADDLRRHALGSTSIRAVISPDSILTITVSGPFERQTEVNDAAERILATVSCPPVPLRTHFGESRSYALGRAFGALIAPLMGAVGGLAIIATLLYSDWRRRRVAKHAPAVAPRHEPPPPPTSPAA